MGVLLKDLAKDLGINFNNLQNFVKEIKKIKTSKSKNGLEIRSSESLIDLFLNIKILIEKENLNIPNDKILEIFNKYIKYTKDYSELKKNNNILDKINSYLKDLYNNPEEFKKKIEEKVLFQEKYNPQKLQPSLPLTILKNNVFFSLPNLNDNSTELINTNEQTSINTNNIIELKNIKKIKIKIKNLKNIKNLDNFEIELNNDIYVITGNNGVGKSTLLAALGQLVNKNSLPQEFPGNLFENSQIYFSLTDVNNKELHILYKKFKESTKTKHWQSYLIKNTSTKEVEEKNFGKINGFIESGIEGERLNKFSKELRQKILEHLEKIDFDNKEKNSNLIEEKELTKYFQLITDKKYTFYSYTYKDSYKEIFIYSTEDKNKYLPEFTLSTGEYFILQILSQLIKKINKSLPSLVILDEIELALNPKLQIKFIDFLKKEFCKKYNTTLILSTQSISFIDNIKNVFLIRNNNGNINIFNNFRGKIIKNYLGENKTIYDKLIIVEDILAKIFIEDLISELNTQYLYIVFPFGGKDQIAKHFKEEKIMNQFAKDIMIIYDGDVEEEILKEIKSKVEITGESLKEIKKNSKNFDKEKQEIIEKIKHKYIIKDINTTFLPIKNVEQYVIELIKEEKKEFVEKIHQYIIKNSTFFDLKDKLDLNKDNKTIFEDFIKKLKNTCTYSEVEIKNKLINIILDINKNNSKFKDLRKKIEDFLNN